MIYLESDVTNVCVSRRRPTSITKCQSVSTFSSENLSVSDGEEGHTTDHSHSGTPDVVSTNTDDRLDDRSDDLLSQGSEIPADNTDPAQASDGLSERDGALGQAKAQLDAGQNPNEVKKLRGESPRCQFWSFLHKPENLFRHQSIRYLINPNHFTSVGCKSSS